jgi:TM2 domain-containing membrane protein YozV
LYGKTILLEERSMFCRNCGKPVADQAVMCVSCGCPPRSGTSFCHNCANPTGSDAAVCVRCGVALPTTPPAGPKSKLAAGLLGILLGGLGVHRFYLGYVGIGIAQIAVTIVTFGAGAIWGFIEGILILVGSFNKDAQGRPLKD